MGQYLHSHTYLKYVGRGGGKYFHIPYDPIVRCKTLSAIDTVSTPHKVHGIHSYVFVCANTSNDHAFFVTIQNVKKRGLLLTNPFKESTVTFNIYVNISQLGRKICRNERRLKSFTNKRWKCKACTKVAVPLETARSTKVTVPLETARCTKVIVPLETARSTKVTVPLETARCTKVTVPLETACSTNVTVPLETARSTKATVPLETARSTKVTVPLETARSTKVKVPLETARSTKVTVPLQTARSTKVTVPLETARSINPRNFTPIHRENPQAKTIYIISVIIMKFVCLNFH